MSLRITDKQIKAFLQDYTEHSETMILEEGKEKNEIIAIARAKGYNLKDNTDLAGFKTIYTFADKANLNRARLPKKQLLKALPSMIGKPVDIDHERTYVVGHYIDYRYRAKEDMVIAYGVFYKSNFGEEWEEAKRLFKAKKLATSYEIWCPKNKRKKLPDGTHELLQQEIAGGALLYRTTPAFKDAKVLELAKKNSEAMEKDLIFAKQYKPEELITADGTIPTVKTLDTKQAEEAPVAVVIPKITCSNCSEEFEYAGDMNVKCRKCLAILDKSGTMIYPPQIIDFRVLCPGCSVNRWLLISKVDDKLNLKCENCKKEYQATYNTQKSNEMAKKIDFLYTGCASCYQCGHRIEFSCVSSVPKRNLTCVKCGLEFSYDIKNNNRQKKIKKIVEIDKGSKTSEKGGTKMKKEKVEKTSKKEVVKEHDFLETSEKDNKEVISERIEKAKVEEPKAEVKVEEAKAEVPAEPKKEEVKVEEKIEETKVEEQPEAPVEAEKEAPKAEVVAEKKSCDKCKKETCECEKAEELKPEAKVEEKVEEKPVEEPEVKEDAPEVVEAKETKADKYAKGIRKFATQVKSLKKQLAEGIAFYKANAEEINKRRKDLGDFAKDLTDTDILVDEKFVTAKAEKENADIAKSSVEKVGDKTSSDDYYKDIQKEVNKHAFGN